jgi:DHA2 family multidrug resistance protein-like MFS transporter
MLLTQVDITTGLGTLVTATVVVSLGLAPVFTLATDQVIGSAPVERAGAAAALSETSSELGGALGIAILGSIGAAAYRSQMTAMVSTSVPPDLAEAVRSTLAGALGLAAQLPTGLSAELLETARGAFAHSFDLTALLTAATALASAALVAVVLRQDDSEQVLNPAAVNCG